MQSREKDITETLGLNRPDTHDRRLKRALAAAGAVCIVITSIFLLKMTGKPSAAQFKTEPVRRGDITVMVTATGTLQPTNTVSVGSELSGIIKSVAVTYNDKVSVGQVLARLDTSKLEAQVTQSKAALESAEANILQTRATVMETEAKLAQFRNVRALSNGKVPSQTEMDAAEAAFARARANAASATAAASQARATLQENETDLSKSIIHSPINGIVLSRNIEPGQTVAASFETPVLFTLAEDLAQMELHVNVDEADVGRVQQGQRAIFRVSAYPNRTFEAQITQARYGSTTTSGVVTYETVLKVSNTDLSLRPGMTATADIIVKKIENTLLIPGMALHFIPPGQQEDTKPSEGLLNSLLPHPPRMPQQQRRDTTNGNGRQQIWIVKDRQLIPVLVTTGETSGALTEVVSGDIQPGMEVAVDVEASGT